MFESGNYVILVCLMLSLFPLPPSPYRNHGTSDVVSELSRSLQALWEKDRRCWLGSHFLGFEGKQEPDISKVSLNWAVVRFWLGRTVRVGSAVKNTVTIRVFGVD